MKFLKLRDGLLIVNVASIAALERGGGDAWLKLSDGCSYSLTPDDSGAVLNAMFPIAETVTAESPKPTPAAKAKQRQ